MNLTDMPAEDIEPQVDLYRAMLSYCRENNDTMIITVTHGKKTCLNPNYSLYTDKAEQVFLAHILSVQPDVEIKKHGLEESL